MTRHSDPRIGFRRSQRHGVAARVAARWKLFCDSDLFFPRDSDRHPHLPLLQVGMATLDGISIFRGSDARPRAFCRLGQYFTADRLLRAFSKVPFERVKALVLGNASLVKRPLSQQLEVYLYAQTSIGYMLDVTQALLSLVSVALFIASSYRPPTGVVFPKPIPRVQTRPWLWCSDRAAGEHRPRGYFNDVLHPRLLPSVLPGAGSLRRE